MESSKKLIDLARDKQTKIAVISKQRRISVSRKSNENPNSRLEILNQLNFKKCDFKNNRGTKDIVEIIAPYFPTLKNPKATVANPERNNTMRGNSSIISLITQKV